MIFSKITKYKYSTEVLSYVDKIGTSIFNSKIVDYFVRNDIPLYLYLEDIAVFCNNLHLKDKPIILTEQQLDLILCNVVMSEIMWTSLTEDQYSFTSVDRFGKLNYELTDIATKQVEKKFNDMHDT